MLLVLNVGSSSLKAAVLQATATSSTELWRSETQRQGALQDQLSAWLAPQLERWWPELKAAGSFRDCARCGREPRRWAGAAARW